MAAEAIRHPAIPLEPSRLERFGRRLRVGMVGGGLDSVIGGPHMLGQRVAERFELVAGAFSIDPDVTRATGHAVLLDEDRIYVDWKDMAAAEAKRSDGIDLVVICTPPNSHVPIAEAFLDGGCHVLCEKPLASDLAECERLSATVATADRVFALGHYFSGYPIIRQAREMVRSGALGEVRLVEGVFATGFPPGDVEQPRSNRHWRWNTDQMGPAAILGEVGCHTHHMLEFITGARVSDVSAELETLEPGREVYDNAYLSVRFDAGFKGRIWDSYVAVGNEHGFGFQIYGTEASIRWDQEDPEHLDLRGWDGRRERLSRGGTYLGGDSAAASRFPVGHTEGWGLAIANIYRDLGEVILARELGDDLDAVAERALLPDLADGIAGLALIEAAERSHRDGGAWNSVAGARVDEGAVR